MKLQKILILKPLSNYAMNGLTKKDQSQSNFMMEAMMKKLLVLVTLFSITPVFAMDIFRAVISWR